MNAALADVPPGCASDVISHEGQAFLFNVSGEMIHEVDGTTYHLEAWDPLHRQSN